MKDVRKLVKVKPLQWSNDDETESTSDQGYYVTQDLDSPDVWRAWLGEDDIGDDFYSMKAAQDFCGTHHQNYIYSLLEAA